MNVSGCKENCRAFSPLPGAPAHESATPGRIRIPGGQPNGFDGGRPAGLPPHWHGNGRPGRHCNSMLIGWPALTLTVRPEVLGSPYWEGSTGPGGGPAGSGGGPSGFSFGAPRPTDSPSAAPRPAGGLVPAAGLPPTMAILASPVGTPTMENVPSELSWAEKTLPSLATSVRL